MLKRFFAWETKYSYVPETASFIEVHTYKKSGSSLTNTAEVIIYKERKLQGKEMMKNYEGIQLESSEQE